MNIAVGMELTIRMDLNHLQDYGEACFIRNGVNSSMEKFMGKTVHVSWIEGNCFHIEEDTDSDKWWFTPEMTVEYLIENKGDINA